MRGGDLPLGKLLPARIEMGCSRVTVGLMIAVAWSIAAPGTLLADDYQTPGYAAPAPRAPGTGVPDLTIPKPQADGPAPGMGIPDLATAKPQADAAAKPEPTFRDRLMQLDGVGPTAQIQPQPGFTTRD